MKATRKLFLVGAMAMALTISQAQTWLEGQLNSQTLTTPPTSGSANAYSEPFDQSWRQGNTGIGTSGWPLTKFNVHHNDNIDAQLAGLLSGTGFTANCFTGLFTNGGTSTINPVGVMGYVYRDDITDGNNYGVMGIAQGSNLGSNGDITGVQAYALGDDNEYAHGVNASARGNNNGEIVGVFGKAFGSGQTIANIGVHGDAEPDNDANSVNFGVEGVETFSPALDNVGVKGTGCNASSFNAGVWGVGCGAGFAGYFDGNVTVTGTLTPPSDARLKENIKPLNDIISQINRLKVYTYNFKANTGINLPANDRLQYGVLAQELETVMPELVHDRTVVVKSEDPKNPYRTFKEIKTVDYQALIPILVKGMQELSQKLEMLDKDKALAMLAAIQQELNNAGYDNITQDVYLNAIPNPSTNAINIKYRYADCNNCTLIITDLKGTLIKTIRMNTNEGETTLYKSDLNSGVYLCNLLANGKVISSTRIAFID